MPSVSPIKQSPIAAYLTTNKAISKRINKNLWLFFSPEGLLLGKQLKMEQNNTNAYLREIYGEGFKKLFYECKVIGQQCTYYKDDHSPIGINIAPVKSYILTHSIDFLRNIVHSNQIEKSMINRQKLIAIEPNVGVGIFDINKPFMYKNKLLLEKTDALKNVARVKHTIN